jgi:hypothetical protein
VVAAATHVEMSLAKTKSVLLLRGAEACVRLNVQAGKLTLAEAEAVIHRLLPASLPPKAFQALMHCVAVRVLPALYDQSPDASFPGCADRCSSTFYQERAASP